MMNWDSKKHVFAFSVFIALCMYFLFYAVTYAIVEVSKSDLRTPDECMQLIGMMKDTENFEKLVKKYPDINDQSRTDNCLSGLKEFDESSHSMLLFFPLLGFILVLIYLYRCFAPYNDKQQKDGSVL